MDNRVAALSSVMFHRLLALAALGLLFGSGLTVFSRRLAGALESALPSESMAAVGLVAAALAALVRQAWTAPNRPLWRVDWITMLAATLAVVMLGAGLSLPDAAPAGLALLWLILLGEESWAWGRHIRRTEAVADVERRSHTSILTRLPQPFNPDATMPPDEVMQQLTRSLATDGTDELSGWLRFVFEAGRRTGSLHVAFCPPFAAAPQLEVEQIDGPEVRIKPAQVLPYGVRLDLKLATTAEIPSRVLLQFSARTTPENPC